jgi:hypothetical protein
MKNTFLWLLTFLLIGIHPLYADLPDTLLVTDLTRDTVNEIPKGWEQILPPKQHSYTSYAVEFTGTGPYIHTVSNSTGSWIEKKMNDLNIMNYPIMEWEWMVNTFPQVEWERDRNHDDFAIRVELVFDFKGGKNPLNLIKKGLITSLFKHYPPELIISYVWSEHVPVEEEYASPSTDRMIVIPIESDPTAIRRWMHEKRDIRVDLKKYQHDQHLVLKKIRIRTDTENSGTIADSGVRNIRLFLEKK